MNVLAEGARETSKDETIAELRTQVNRIEASQDNVVAEIAAISNVVDRIEGAERRAPKVTINSTKSPTDQTEEATLGKIFQSQGIAGKTNYAFAAGDDAESVDLNAVNFDEVPQDLRTQIARMLTGNYFPDRESEANIEERGS